MPSDIGNKGQGNDGRRIKVIKIIKRATGQVSTLYGFLTNYRCIMICNAAVIHILCAAPWWPAPLQQPTCRSDDDREGGCRFSEAGMRHYSDQPPSIICVVPVV